MTKRIHVCVAWPYAAGDRHIGHLAGAYLPPDIFARYHRLAGNQVLMVSGSDTHGTPITLRADKDGSSPAQVVEHYHGRFVEGFQQSTQRTLYREKYDDSVSESIFWIGWPRKLPAMKRRKLCFSRA